MMKPWIAVVVALWTAMAWGQAQDAGTAAGGAREHERDNRPAVAPVDAATPAMMLQRSGGSLFKASLGLAPDPTRPKLSQISFLAVPDPEPKTVKKHDLVTIVIREESEYTSDGTTDLKKNANVSAQLDQWVSLKPGNFAIQGGAQGATPPGVSAKGSRNFKGEAKVDRTDSLTLRIAAEVVDVKPNGTFTVQARKHIKHDDDEQDYLLTGVCRAGDLTPDNTLLSTQIHDLNIETTTKGAVKDTTNRGWVPKLLDFINPF
jgi:flagellar L-ring protein precursor FlgH